MYHIDHLDAELATKTGKKIIVEIMMDETFTANTR